MSKCCYSSSSLYSDLSDVSCTERISNITPVIALIAFLGFATINALGAARVCSMPVVGITSISVLATFKSLAFIENIERPTQDAEKSYALAMITFLAACIITNGVGLAVCSNHTLGWINSGVVLTIAGAGLTIGLFNCIRERCRR